MKGLEFYLTRRLTRYPAAVSWVLADNPRNHTKEYITHSNSSSQNSVLRKVP